MIFYLFNIVFPYQQKQERKEKREKETHQWLDLRATGRRQCACW